MTYFRTLALVFMLLSIGAGCAEDDDQADKNDDQPSNNTLYDLCGDDVTQGEMDKFINGNCVIVGSFSEEGFPSGALVAGMMLSMAAKVWRI